MYDVITRPYYHASVLDQQIVRERALPCKDGLKYHLILLFTVVMCALLFVWSRIEVVQLGYQISQANNVYQERIKENRRLMVEALSLQSLSRIETIATKEIGMIHPKEDQIIFLP